MHINTPLVISSLSMFQAGVLGFSVPSTIHACIHHRFTSPDILHTPSLDCPQQFVTGMKNGTSRRPQKTGVCVNNNNRKKVWLRCQLYLARIVFFLNRHARRVQTLVRADAICKVADVMYTDFV